MIKKYGIPIAAATIVGIGPLIVNAAQIAEIKEAIPDDAGNLAASAEADSSLQPTIDGAALFVQRCKVCHTTEADQPSYGGPNLAGVVGRAAASAQYRYSRALRNSGLTWTLEDLDAFLASPRAKVPGTSMFVSLADAGQRQAVIEFLGATASETVAQP